MLTVTALLPQCSVGGGPKTILSELQWLHQHGHNAQLVMVGRYDGWWPVNFPIHQVSSYDEAAAFMSPLPGIKIATWWETARPVMQACAERGVPVYRVQDIETWYYPEDMAVHPQILDTYQLPWRAILTIAPCTTERLMEMGVTSPIRVLPPPVDLSIFRPMADIDWDPNLLIYIPRSVHLKGLGLMQRALELLERWEVDLKVDCFGVEPNIHLPLERHYLTRISDADAARLYSSAFCYVSTSIHEGFGVPIVEAMACGTPVITTHSDGNDHFCHDEINCLVVSHDPAELASAICWLRKRPALQASLRAGGLRTAQRFNRETLCRRLERLYKELMSRS